MMANFRWIGVLPSDFDLLVDEEDQFAPLTEEDHKKLNSLLRRESVARTPNLLREIELMKAADKKAEIQGKPGASNNFQQFSDVKSSRQQNCIALPKTKFLEC